MHSILMIFNHSSNFLAHRTKAGYLPTHLTVHRTKEAVMMVTVVTVSGLLD
jgi:hypothetical protein